MNQNLDGLECKDCKKTITKENMHVIKRDDAGMVLKFRKTICKFCGAIRDKQYYRKRFNRSENPNALSTLWLSKKLINEIYYNSKRGGE